MLSSHVFTHSISCCFVCSVSFRFIPFLHRFVLFRFISFFAPLRYVLVPGVSFRAVAFLCVWFRSLRSTPLLHVWFDHFFVSLHVVSFRSFYKFCVVKLRLISSLLRYTAFRHASCFVSSRSFFLFHFIPVCLVFFAVILISSRLIAFRFGSLRFHSVSLRIWTIRFVQQPTDDDAETHPPCSAPATTTAAATMGKRIMPPHDNHNHNYNPLDNNVDLVGEVAGWFDAHQYLFFALVSTTWKNAWQQQRQRPRLTRAVTANTSTEMLNYCFDIGLKRSGKVCSAAASMGKVKLLEFSLANGCQWNSATCAKAAEAGHFGLLRWARKNGCPWNSKTCESAARHGHLSILEWARDHGCPSNDVDVCHYAARGGHVDVLRWVGLCLPYYLRASNAVCDGAALGGHLSCLKWARSKVKFDDCHGTAGGAAETSTSSSYRLQTLYVRKLSPRHTTP